jgi:hypothetical protein
LIIKRLTTSIRQQDWFSVAVELLIVVVGIFLGIQAADWNDNRKARAEEHSLLVRLHEDVEESADAMKASIETLTDWRDRAESILKGLMTGVPDAEQTSGFPLVAATRIGLAEPQLATLNELISGGRLNEISDAEIRSAIARFDAVIKARVGHIQILVDYAAEITPSIHEHLRPSLPPMRRGSVSYDFDALAKNVEFQNLLGSVIRIQTSNITWMAQMEEEMRSLDRLLEVKLGIAP